MKNRAVFGTVGWWKARKWVYLKPCRNKRWGQIAPVSQLLLPATPTVGGVQGFSFWGQKSAKNRGMGSKPRIIGDLKGR